MQGSTNNVLARGNVVLEGKKILVVGGSSGIGLALANELVELKATVIVGSRSQNNLDIAQKLIPGITHCIKVDASSEASVKYLLEQIGDFDHLISTIRPAHFTCEFLHSSITDTRAAFESKFWGQYNLTRLCLDQISKSGSIILTSGIASQKSYKGFSGMAAINGAIESFGKSVSTEIAPVRINVVSPGFIARTDNDTERLNYVKQLGANISLQRLGNTKEVVSAFIYLLMNTYTTGTTITVDGGETCASGTMK